MTIKEFMELMQDLIQACPHVANCKMEMVGHDANGERIYNIPVIDYTCNPDEEILRLWDN